ncbi:MAG: hypothetical protein K940chlam5_00414 [Candidatus Anoxychlamydiales bacterium]|nr:hypothetical protein [Candidatus Anoxychlamydiales bacterium]
MKISKILVLLFLFICSSFCAEAYIKKDALFTSYTEEVPIKCSTCGDWYYTSSGHTCSK